MSTTRRSPVPRGTGQLLATIAAAACLLLSLAVPAAAVEGPTKLYAASASPASGTTATTITFGVGYRNREGSEPAFVQVVIDGTPRDMTGDGSTDWKNGVVYAYSTTLPVGTHTFSFVASDTRRFTDEAVGGTITISAPPTPAPTPTPTPTPKATSTPKPKATTSPTATPGPTSAPVQTPTPGSTDTPTPGAATDPSPGSTATPSPTATPTASADGPGGPGTSVGPSTGPDATDGWLGGPGSVDPSAEPDPSGEAVIGAQSDTTTGNPSPRGAADPPAAGVGWGAMMAALSALGLDHGTPHLGLLPTLVGTSGAVAMGMAFALFGKKRRDEEQPAPDEVLKAKAARGSGVAASGELVGARPFSAPLEGEAAMPRWRRPSLLEARKADPTRSVSTNHRLAFTDGAVEGEGPERRAVRYRVVRLLDAPDELRSAEIGQLDQGDEVQLLERSGAYWLVLCPDGRRGWLHKMTLGAIVDDAPSPTAAEAWGAPEPPGDILQSMLDARARA